MRSSDFFVSTPMRRPLPGNGAMTPDLADESLRLVGREVADRRSGKEERRGRVGQVIPQIEAVGEVGDDAQHLDRRMLRRHPRQRFADRVLRDVDREIARRQRAIRAMPHPCGSRRRRGRRTAGRGQRRARCRRGARRRSRARCASGNTPEARRSRRTARSPADRRNSEARCAPATREGRQRAPRARRQGRVPVRLTMRGVDIVLLGSGGEPQ